MNKLKLKYEYLGYYDNTTTYTHKIKKEHLKKHKITKEDIELLDEYYNYICSLIDDCDAIFLEASPKVVNKLKRNLKYKYYDELEALPIVEKSTNYLFDIRDEKSKELVKKIICFNLSDDIGIPFICKTDRNYIANNLKMNRNSRMFLVKNNYIKYALCNYDGYIDDYQPFNKRKWKKVEDIDLIFKYKNKNWSKEKIPPKAITREKLIKNQSLLIRYIEHLRPMIYSSDYCYVKIDKEILTKWKQKFPNSIYNLYINNQLQEKMIPMIEINTNKEKFDREFQEVLLNYIHSKSNKNVCIYFATRTHIIGILQGKKGYIYDEGSKKDI